MQTTVSAGWLSEVHDPESVLAVGLSVLHTEVEPLLMATGVSVHLHVKLVLTRTHHFCLEQVTALEHRVKQQDVVVVFLQQFLLQIVLLSQVLYQPIGQVSALASTHH